MVSLAMLAPYTSAKWALISPVVRPLAVSESTIRSTPSRRRFPFGTITGSNVPALSLGTSMLTGPTSVRTVLARVPLREFPEWWPAGSCGS